MEPAAPRIMGMAVRNIKRVRLATLEFDPERRVVVVSGRNGAGKSSLLDAMLYALSGPNRKDTPHPVTDGEEEGSVTLDLDTLTVMRKIGVDGKTIALEVRDKATGASLRSPQKQLNDLLGEFNAFDPIEFMAQSAKDQVTALLAIVDLPFDPVALDQQRQLFYDRRREINREVERLGHQLEGVPAIDPSLPVEEISTAAIVEEVRVAEQELALNRSIRSQHERAQQAATHAAGEVDRLTAELAAAKEKWDAAVQEESDLAVEAAELVDPDISVLQTRMAEAEGLNLRIRAGQQRRRLADEHAGVAAESADFTAKIEAIDATKSEALARADMPVPGLSFDDAGLTLDVDGTIVPLVQCSTAEQLRVSMAMAMRANPKIRIVRIADGSLLDAESMRLVGELAEANDFYVFVERVADDLDAGVVEITADGEVHT